MADNFEITNARPSEDFAPNGLATPVMIVEALSKPHDVVLSVSVPKTPGWKEAALQALHHEATEVESLWDA